jgi:hypothetical protein
VPNLTRKVLEHFLLPGNHREFVVLGSLSNWRLSSASPAFCRGNVAQREQLFALGGWPAPRRPSLYPIQTREAVILAMVDGLVVVDDEEPSAGYCGAMNATFRIFGMASRFATRIPFVRNYSSRAPWNACPSHLATRLSGRHSTPRFERNSGRHALAREGFK